MYLSLIQLMNLLKVELNIYDVFCQQLNDH